MAQTFLSVGFRDILVPCLSRQNGDSKVATTRRLESLRYVNSRHALNYSLPWLRIAGQAKLELGLGASDNPRMIISGILNPQILSLLARIRHTNALVIADRGFPFWPQIETVDISLVDDLPTVLQVIAAARANHQFTQAFMAKEFLKNSTPAVRQKFAAALKSLPTTFEPHVEFKKRVPNAIGLIRTGDTIQYANTILISG